MKIFQYTNSDSIFLEAVHCTGLKHLCLKADMDYKRLNESPILVNPITAKESTTTAAPVWNISSLIGCCKLPVN